MQCLRPNIGTKYHSHSSKLCCLFVCVLALFFVQSNRNTDFHLCNSGQKIAAEYLASLLASSLSCAQSCDAEQKILVFLFSFLKYFCDSFCEDSWALTQDLRLPNGSAAGKETVPSSETPMTHRRQLNIFFFVLFLFLFLIERDRSLSSKDFFFLRGGVNRKQGESQRWDPFSSSERSDIWNKEVSYVSTCVWDRQTDRGQTLPAKSTAHVGWGHTRMTH